MNLVLEVPQHCPVISSTGLQLVTKSPSSRSKAGVRTMVMKPDVATKLFISPQCTLAPADTDWIGVDLFIIPPVNLARLFTAQSTQFYCPISYFLSLSGPRTLVFMI